MTATRCVLLVAAVWCGPARAAAQVADRDSVVYVLTPASQLEVRTGKAGLLGFAGHEHVVRARSCSGRIVHYPSSPEDSRVEVAVPVDSLEVLTPPDTAEIRKVTATMRSDVLHPDQYPLITFVSTGVRRTGDGLEVSGRLTMVGQTHEVAVALRLQIAGDTLQAIGRFSVKQTDFGIKPYRGGPAGTVRVADRVEFNLAAVAIRSTSQ
ncbi:MAG TPA: YceI family protein [Gemmatimonadales bacterium]|nr:YceI family protein [Gemmatimonadales bacterium]